MFGSSLQAPLRPVALFFQLLQPPQQLFALLAELLPLCLRNLELNLVRDPVPNQVYFLATDSPELPLIALLFTHQ